MTVERLVQPEPGLSSHRVQEPTERLLLPRVVEASSRVNGTDNGHRTWNQTIHHLFEPRNKLRTSRFKNIPAGGTVEIYPADTGAVTVRLAGGTVNMNLRKPPRPAQAGSTRVRHWEVRVRIFYAAETTLTWSKTPIGPTRQDLDTTGPAPVLLEEEVLPGAPGLAGTSDVFDLIYDEQSGEWFCDWYVRGRVTADPEVPPEEPTTDPNPPPGQTDPTSPPGDGVDPDDPANAPEDTYTDPETGEPMEPEQPAATEGDLVAIHDGSLSYSVDGGATWRQIQGSPANPVSASVLRGEGAVVVDSDGRVWFSPDLQNWRQIPIEALQQQDALIENGDFETGDLTGWEDVGENTPRVLDTSRPAQRPGSQYYLTRDWRVAFAQPFKLRQTVAFPPGSIGGTMRLTADAWAASGSDAILRVLTEPYIAGPRSGAYSNISSSGFVLTGWGEDQNGDPLDLRLVGGDANGLRPPVSLANSGPAGVRSFEVRSGTAIYQGPVFFPIAANASIPGARVRIAEEDVLALYAFPVSGFGGESWVPPAPVGGFYDIDPTDIFGASIGGSILIGVVFKTGAFSVDFVSPCSASFGRQREEWMAIPAQSVEAETTRVGTWEEIHVDVFASGSNFTVELEGTGFPVDVYFDNIGGRATASSADRAYATTADYGSRRHVVATASRVYEIRGGAATLIAATPAPGVAVSDLPIVAAHGPRIAVARGSNVSVSLDNGETWAQHSLSSGIAVQVFVAETYQGPGGSDRSGDVLVMLGSGTVVVIRDDGTTENITGAGTGARLSYDRRRARFVFTSTNGQVRVFTGSLVGSTAQPAASAARTRYTVPTDIGRWFGYAQSGRDVFYTDQPTNEWSLAPSLPAGILHFLEVR